MISPLYTDLKSFPNFKFKFYLNSNSNFYSNFKEATDQCVQ